MSMASDYGYKTMIAHSASIPLSLYIHVPWCVQKCPYCDFNSHTLRENIDEKKYIQALLDDLEQDLAYTDGRSITSIFLGGGTPSLLSGKAINTLIAGIQKRLPLSSDTEITLEANPGTVETGKFKAFFEAGVNRLSIGVQSFQDHHLKKLGRIHGRQEAIRAVEAARMAGFTNFNLDLMHGLPDQSIDEALEDLKTALLLKPPHLSWYQLTIEPNTLFFVKQPKLPDEPILSAISDQGISLIESAGYHQYEVSAFSHKNHQCLHNINYWEFGDYLGIGPGAHGKITQNNGTILRTSKYKHPKQYLTQSKPTETKTVVHPSNQLFELLMNALRLKNGIATSKLERIEMDMAEVRSRLTPLINDDLLEFNNERLKTTSLGFRYLNEVLERLL